MAKRRIPRLVKPTEKTLAKYARYGAKCRIWNPDTDKTKYCTAAEYKIEAKESDNYVTSMAGMEGYMDPSHVMIMLTKLSKRPKKSLLNTAGPYIPLKEHVFAKKIGDIKLKCFQPGRSKKRKSCITDGALKTVRRVLGTKVTPVVSGQGDFPVFFYNSKGEALVVAPAIGVD